MESVFYLKKNDVPRQRFQENLRPEAHAGKGEQTGYQVGGRILKDRLFFPARSNNCAAAAFKTPPIPAPHHGV